MGKGTRNRRLRQSAIGSIDRDQRRALQRIINEETVKVVHEWDAKYWDDVVASILWTLHISEGFGIKRLKRFYDAFDRIHDELREHYHSDDEFMNGWTCYVKLKDAGADLAAWKAEADARRKGGGKQA